MKSQTACKIRAFVHVVENYSNVSSLKRANLLRKARPFFYQFCYRNDHKEVAIE